MPQRDINEIMKDLTTVTNDITAKKKALDDANKAQSAAFQAHDKAQNSAVGLRKELDTALDLLVPASLHDGRVRQSV